MQRLIWLALLCVVGIGGLFVIRSLMGASAVSHRVPEVVAPEVIAPVVTDDAPALPKGDRLPSRFFDSAFDGALPKPAVETLKIVPAEAPKPPEAAKDDVISWHWHEGSKVVRRRRAQ